MLRVENLSYSIGKKTILNNVRFNAKPGRIVALLGPNGAGKSTIIRLLANQYKCNEGKITWLGNEMKSYRPNKMAVWRAVMTQNIDAISNFKLKDVVMMGRYPFFKSIPGFKDYAEVDSNLEILDLTQLAYRHFHELSGGEKQRGHFARALTQLSYSSNSTDTTKLLLLDEPLNNLDIAHQHRCLSIAANFAQRGNVVVMVIHDINLALEYADHMVFLNQGKVIGDGIPEETCTEEMLSSCYNISASTEHVNGKLKVFFNPQTTLNIQ